MLEGETTFREGRYFCDIQDCKNREGFAREHDLKRHQSLHQGPSWFCGCCSSAQSKKPYKSARKDHMLTHLRNRHKMKLPFRGFPCEEKACHGSGSLMFSSMSCLRLHSIKKHSKSSQFERFDPEIRAHGNISTWPGM